MPDTEPRVPPLVPPPTEAGGGRLRRACLRVWRLTGHRVARHLWPDTLFGRLVLVLVTGVLAAQVMTGSIWYDMRRNQALEIPVRLVATHVAEAVRLLERHGAAPADLQELLSSQQFTVAWRAQPWARPAPLSRADEEAEQLLSAVLARKLGRPLRVELLAVELQDAAGAPADWWDLLGSRETSSRLWLQVQLDNGQWFSVHAEEQQGWTSRAPLAVLTDYLLRLYVVRIAVLVLLALLAVRMVVRPLERLAQAAQDLGQHIHHPPIDVRGPAEVRRAAGAFNTMQSRLVAGLAERTRFLAAVSHDLRTPITRLRLRTELLEDEDLQQRFRSDLDSMESLVSATLQIASSGVEHEPLQRVDMDTLLRSLQQDFADMGADVRLQGTAGAPLPGYPRALRRCLQNLLENAVRYGSRARIAVRDTAQALHIVVSDDGPGIPEPLLAQVLEPFFRVDASRHAATGGHGLGLSIAQTVAAAHAGSLQLRNRPEGGLDAVLVLARVRSP